MNTTHATELLRSDFVAWSTAVFDEASDEMQDSIETLEQDINALYKFARTEQPNPAYLAQTYSHLKHRLAILKASV
jgi:hypothetical protein